MKTKLQTLFRLLLVFFCCACANSVKIKETRRSPDAPAMTFSKLLLVSATQKDNLRTMSENILAETLEDHGVMAVPSHKLIKDIGTADRASLEKAALESGADGVVITHTVTKSEHSLDQYFGGTPEVRSVVMRRTEDDGSSLTVGMSAVGIAPRETDFLQGSLRTRFFDARNADLVWVADTEFVNDGRTAEACWDFAILLTKALAKDGLITINDKEFRKPKF